jgi:hypothetical protein
MTDKETKQDDVLDAMAEMPIDFELGEGDNKKSFKVAPLSLGKIRMLTRLLPKLEGVIKVIANKYKPGEDQQQMADLDIGMGETLDGAIEAFYIVAHPNDGTIPDFSKVPAEERQWLEYTIDIVVIQRIIYMLLRQANFVMLLKKVLTLKVAEKPNSTTETSSPQQSSSPAGGSSI